MSKLNLFGQSPLGGFIRSPLGARMRVGESATFPSGTALDGLYFSTTGATTTANGVTLNSTRMVRYTGAGSLFVPVDPPYEFHGYTPSGIAHAIADNTLFGAFTIPIAFQFAPTGVYPFAAYRGDGWFNVGRHLEIQHHKGGPDDLAVNVPVIGADGYVGYHVRLFNLTDGWRTIHEEFESGNDASPIILHWLDGKLYGGFSGYVKSWNGSSWNDEFTTPGKAGSLSDYSGGVVAATSNGVIDANGVVGDLSGTWLTWKICGVQDAIFLIPIGSGTRQLAKWHPDMVGGYRLENDITAPGTSAGDGMYDIVRHESNAVVCGNFTRFGPPPNDLRTPCHRAINLIPDESWPPNHADVYGTGFNAGTVHRVVSSDYSTSGS